MGACVLLAAAYASVCFYSELRNAGLRRCAAGEGQSGGIFEKPGGTKAPGTAEWNAAGDDSRDVQAADGGAGIPPDRNLMRKIDFQALWEKNEDIVGWICIPGTPVDYALVRGTETDEYLHKGADGAYDYAGAIFLLPHASLSDMHCIIYGHNMRSGTMFGSLKKYWEAGYLEKHPCIYLYAPGYSMKAEIFSLFTAESGSGAYRYGFCPGSAEYGRWQKEMASRSEQACGPEVTPGMQCITLSTCVSGGRRSARRVIHAAVTVKTCSGSAGGSVSRGEEGLPR